jgi:glutaminyl-tRNA synthetase
VISLKKRENVIDVTFGVCLVKTSNAPRVMVLDPVKLVITNYPEDESLDENNQEDDSAGFRKLPFPELYREDFQPKV